MRGDPNMKHKIIIMTAIVLLSSVTNSSGFCCCCSRKKEGHKETHVSAHKKSSFVAKHEDQPELITAIESGDTNAALSLISTHPEQTSLRGRKHSSPFVIAVQKGNIAVVQALQDSGVKTSRDSQEISRNWAELSGNGKLLNILNTASQETSEGGI